MFSRPLKRVSTNTVVRDSKMKESEKKIEQVDEIEKARIAKAQDPRIPQFLKGKIGGLGEPLPNRFTGRYPTFRIEGVLATALTVDYFVVHKGRNHKRPASKTVNQILEAYFATLPGYPEKLNTVGATVTIHGKKHSLIGLVNSTKCLRDIFDYGFRGLVYPIEKSKPEYMNESVFPSTKYGLLHLLRFLSRFGDIAHKMNWNDQSEVDRVTQLMEPFVSWLFANGERFYQGHAEYIGLTEREFKEIGVDVMKKMQK